MKLYVSATSPYARKVRIALIELELEQQVRLVSASPLEDPPELHEINPLGKIPTLRLADNRVIYDSPVICAYIDGLSENISLIPSDVSARFDALTREAGADGMLDAAFSIVMERRRPAEQQSAYWIERWKNAIRRTAEYFNQRIDASPPRFDIGDITLAVALDYIDYRLSDLNLFSELDHLKQWRASVIERPSLIRTHPDNSVA